MYHTMLSQAPSGSTTNSSTNENIHTESHKARKGASKFGSKVARVLGRSSSTQVSLGHPATNGPTHRLMIDVFPVAASPSTSTFRTTSEGVASTIPRRRGKGTDRVYGKVGDDVSSCCDSRCCLGQSRQRIEVEAHCCVHWWYSLPCACLCSVPSAACCVVVRLIVSSQACLLGRTSLSR
jgi:hypothetical protein